VRKGGFMECGGMGPGDWAESHSSLHLPAAGRPRHGLEWDSDGCTQAKSSPAVPAVYLDNSSLELYHGRLDKRPNAIALRIR
jgi:SPX domain protein involved in polyphosphate accumulation